MPITRARSVISTVRSPWVSRVAGPAVTLSPGGPGRGRHRPGAVHARRVRSEQARRQGPAVSGGAGVLRTQGLQEVQELLSGGGVVGDTVEEPVQQAFDPVRSHVDTL